MKSYVVIFCCFCSLWALGQSHSTKKITFSNGQNAAVQHKTLNLPSMALPYAGRNLLESPSAVFKPISSMALPTRSNGYTVLSLDEKGQPNKISFHAQASRNQTNGAAYYAQELAKVFDLKSIYGVTWETTQEQVDELGIRHFRFQQYFDGYPIEGAEYLVHEYTNGETIAHGSVRFPEASVNRVISEKQAFQLAMESLQKSGVHCSQTMPGQPSYIKTGLQDSHLIYASVDDGIAYRLVYALTIFPNPLKKYLVWVDAENGSIIKQRTDHCHLHVHTDAHCAHTNFNPEGAETSTGKDLFDITRTLNVWREGSFQYLIDASRPMFKSGSFKLDNPVGAIWTLDALNSNPDNLRVDQVKSSNNTWSRTAVSAHHNGGLAYEYFRNTHARNSINGTGGTIISIINVAEVGGVGMDNAFWNGEAMFYGNGATAFNALAKGLDVAGHEMSHGVIQSTANLNYENESGAINESFADVFGSMIDRDDWKIGEDVVKLSTFPSGALRDMSDPHNGAQSGDFTRWQPKHVNEQYKGTQDNGGVHINSGIPNHAFYLFVKEMAKTSNEAQAKDVAEKVYYRALAQYLSRSSVFKDLRNAVEQACIDLHGNNTSVHNAAKLAFDQVGIGSSGTPGGSGQQYQKDLKVNPGDQFVVFTDQNNEGVYLVNLQNNQISLLSNATLKSKPSVSDDGSTIVYVDEASGLYALNYNASKGRYEEFVLDADPIYRNAVISKDGRLLAVLYDLEENKIHIYDFSKRVWKTYTLTNPTTSGGVKTSNVRYADIMDFQHSGEYLVYDAKSKLERNTGGSYEYWDIGFLRVFDVKSNQFGDGQITKLFSDLPENTSIGNPTFSKNSPYIIAFDYLEEDLFGSTFSILGANIETGSVMEIANNRDDFGYPNFSVDDKFLMYDGYDNFGSISLKYKALAANKIQSAGNEQLFLSEARWGSFFANGQRVLIKNKDLEIFTEMEVYPNPFGEHFVLTFTSKQSTSCKLELSDAMGQIIETRSADIQQGLNQIQWTGVDQAKGMYYLKVLTEEGSKVLPLVKF